MAPCTDVPGNLEEYLQSVYKSMHMCDSPLSKAFFSVSNINDLQDNIQYIIRKETRHNIDRQSDRELIAIMKGVFEAFAADQYNAARAEIKRLNLIVLDIVVDQVKEGINGYLTYLQDASTLPEPLSRGQFASIRGENTLELTPAYGFK